MDIGSHINQYVYELEILLKSGYGHLACDSLSTLIKEKAQLSLQNVPTKEYSFPQRPSGLRELHESWNHNESTKFNVAHLVNLNYRSVIFISWGFRWFALFDITASIYIDYLSLYESFQHFINWNTSPLVTISICDVICIKTHTGLRVHPLCKTWNQNPMCKSAVDPWTIEAEQWAVRSELVTCTFGRSSQSVVRYEGKLNHQGWILSLDEVCMA